MFLQLVLAPSPAPSRPPARAASSAPRPAPSRPRPAPGSRKPEPRVAPLRIPPRPRLGATLLPPLPTRLTIAVTAAGGEVQGVAAPRQNSPEPRQVATLKPGERPRLRWSVANTDLRAGLPSLAIHFLIVRQDAPGQAVPAEPRKGSHADTVLGTELPRGGKVEGSHTTALDDPGFYLVQLEVLDPLGNRRQSCVLELKVAP